MIGGYFHYDGWDPPLVLLAGLCGFAVLANIYISFCWYLDRRATKAISQAPQKPSAPFIEDIPDLRVADSDLALALFESKERDRLLPLLEAEKLSSWARPMHGPERGKDPPPVIIRGDVWRTHYLQSFPKTEGQFRAQTFLKTRARHESSYFDVLFNKAQIERIWPAEIPLVDAARRLYEAAEAASVLNFFVLKTDSPEEKLSHLKMLLMIDERVEVLGARPPSTQVRPITKTELIDELYPAKGNINEIVGLTSDEPIFVDVAVKHATLIQFIEVSIAEAKGHKK